MDKNLKIVIIGSSSKWAISSSYKRAFENDGHQCRIIDPKDLYFSSILASNRVTRKVLWEILKVFPQRKLAKKVIKSNPDIVFVFKGWYLSPLTLKKVKDNSKSVLFHFSPDDFKNDLNTNSLIRKSIPLYDCLFTPRREAVREIEDMGGKKAHYLPFALDSSIHNPPELDDQEVKALGADVVFIGTYAQDNRSEYLEKLCKEDFDIKVFGNSWEKHPPDSCLRKSGSIQSEDVYGEDMCKVLSSSKIALAFLRHRNRDKHTMRTFEIPGCKTFMLHERTEEVTDILNEGQQADFFDSYEEMKEKIEFYLNNPQKRKDIAQSGYEEIIKEKHSYMNRVKEVLNIYKKIRQ